MQTSRGKTPQPDSPEAHKWRAYGQPDGTVVCDDCNIAADVNDLLKEVAEYYTNKFLEAAGKVPVIDPAMGWSNNRKDIYVKAQVEMRKRIVNKLRSLNGRY